MGVRDGDAEAGPVEQLAVVLAVPSRDRLLGAEPEPLGDEGEAAALAHVRMCELEEVRQRLRDEEATSEPRLELGLERLKLARIADRDELRRIAREPGAQIADGVDRDVLELGVAFRLGVDLRDVQLVVDVGVEMEAGVEDGVHRFARVGERDRDVKQKLAAPRIGDRRTLVTDNRLVSREVRPDRAEHPSRHDDHVRARGANARQSSARTRPQHAVFGDQRPVEIESERGYTPREGRRKVYGTVPPVDFTT